MTFFDSESLTPWNTDGRHGQWWRRTGVKGGNRDGRTDTPSMSRQVDWGLHLFNSL